MPPHKSELDTVWEKEIELASFLRKAACLGRESMSFSEGKEVKLRKDKRGNGSVENWINMKSVVT